MMLSSRAMTYARRHACHQRDETFTSILHTLLPNRVSLTCRVTYDRLPHLLTPTYISFSELTDTMLAYQHTGI